MHGGIAERRQATGDDDDEENESVAGNVCRTFDEQILDADRIAASGNQAGRSKSVRMAAAIMSAMRA